MKIKFNPASKFGRFLLGFIQKYNHDKYWNRRLKVISPAYKNIILKLYYLYYIKKIDDFYNCSFGTNYNSGSQFKSPPILPHGPKNIIIGHDITIGSGVTILQSVTVIHGGKSIIGNNVLLSAGSVILKGVNIGDNVKVGANAIVVEDIPDGCTVVLPKPRVISPLCTI